MLNAECYVLFVIVSQEFYGHNRKTLNFLEPLLNI